ncbi:MAG: helix-turn-helix domain-containing protein, partial [Chitinophagales bacterium]
MPSDENIRLIFGIKLKYLRTKRKLNPLQLSEKTGISNSYLNEIEKGKKYPKAEKISALALALDVKYDELVSIKLPKEFAALELLLQSNTLSDLPLDMLGFDLSSLVELLANSPMKINAFLNTIVEIARNHDLQTEYFYFSVLRSYQELKENFFEDTEQAVLNFRIEYGLKEDRVYDSTVLKKLLTDNYAYQFAFLPKHLSNLRAVFRDEEKVLYLNPNLSEHQLLFVLGRELAFNFMPLQPRPVVTTHFNNPGFAEIFNNFLASYFATALVMPQKRVVEDLKVFFEEEYWNADKFAALADAFGVSPEMYMHRLTNVLPKFFKLNSLFFLRLSKPQSLSRYNITKELHLGRLHNPHASSKDLHYCRRWISLQILNDLEVQQASSNPADFNLVKAQISNYMDSKDSYFIISAARPMYPVSGYSTSVSIGILINENFKRVVKFHKDTSIVSRLVSEACETCSIMDCTERAVDPHIFKAR